MIEKQEEISLAEFKAWLAGLIRGKRGALPDLDDWKAIKDTLDKVVPDTIEAQPTWTPPTVVREIIREPAPLPEPVPYINPYPTIWITEPNTWWPKNGDVWCGGGAGDIPYADGYAGDNLQASGYSAGGCVSNAGAGGSIGSLGAGGAGGACGAGGGVSGCSTINLDNSAMSPTHVEGDVKEMTSGYVTLSPEQMQFTFTTSDDSEEELDNAMAALFATGTEIA